MKAFRAAEMKMSFFDSRGDSDTGIKFVPKILKAAENVQRPCVCNIRCLSACVVHR